MRELISIIIPVFNCEEYLRACVASILDQTHQEFELIFIDGGGSDGSGAICDELAKQDSRIIVLHKANEGVSVARNKGIELATGSRLCFIDSDDTVAKDYLEKLYRLAKASGNPDLVLCNIADVQVGKKPIKRQLQGELTGCFQQDYLTLHSLLIGPVVKLYNSEIIKKHHILFPAGISCGEDELFNFQYYRYVKKYAFLDEGLYYYYHRPNASLSQKQSMAIYKGMLYKLRLEKEFYVEQKLVHTDQLLNESALTIVYNYYRLGLEDERAGFCERLEELLPYLTLEAKPTTSRDKALLELLKARDYAGLYALITAKSR